MLNKLLQGRYQVVQLLSAGGFCQTYLAKDTCRPGCPTCVIKHLLPVNNHPQSLETLKRQFTREAEALKKLDRCDLVPQLIDHFEENLKFYLVQEFIEGHPLSAELQRGFRWSESFVVQLLQEVLGILEVIHSQGIIHRDIKPSNLIRRRQDDHLVLIDFGSVKQAWTQVVTAPDKTNTTTKDIPATIAIGTPGYMPPEQVRGLPRLNSDIYALGMIAIQALTGLYPKQLLEDSDTGEIIWQHQANVSPKLAWILNKMVLYHFKDRYQSATEVLTALKSLDIAYQPTYHSSFFQQKVTSAQLASSATKKLPVLFSEQETNLFNWSDRSEALLDNTNDTTHHTLPNRFVLLLGMGIGIVSVLAIAIGIYYFLRLPAPAFKQQNQTILIKNSLQGIVNLIPPKIISTIPEKKAANYPAVKLVDLPLARLQNKALPQI